ncbi:MAG: glutamate-5-semialdehyde dehydrogenase [Candidatus Hydrogenedentota bacterium]|nr:MAG: glutamate-5-semialdehyde dehydrogenase [Candidatus Hydrogenedentota bacterium]
MMDVVSTRGEKEEGSEIPSAGELVREARAAARILLETTGSQRKEALSAIADALEAREKEILAANRRDLERATGITEAFRDRLTLTPERVKKMAAGVRTVAGLTDPVGEIVSGWTLPNGLRIEQVRVPIGVVAVIYESRPNVTADAAALTLKSGNAIILRGGKEAFSSNAAIADVIAEALDGRGLPAAAVSFVRTTDRSFVDDLLSLEGELDVVIPRGGEGLIRRVVERSRVPVIYHGAGICHTYIDADADLEKAERIVVNAKCSRPGVCNAMETLLVHRAIAEKFLPRLEKVLEGVELRGCERSRAFLSSAKPATEEDWAAEYLSKILAVRVVESVEEAVDHIERYGSHLADAIVTESISAAERFTRSVDSAAVYVNASTRFTDGGEFGLGAEIGISTQKLHARGPMGPRELTTTKYVVRGDGQVRD